MAINFANGGTQSRPAQVLQVVQAVKTDRVAQTTSGSTEYTIMSASITPSSTSSKILVLVDMKGDVSAGYDAMVAVLRRNGTTIYVGDAGSSSYSASASFFQTPSNRPNPLVIHYEDSPGTTSALTYSIIIKDFNADGGVFYINRSAGYGDNNASFTSPSSIILMEIAS